MVTKFHPNRPFVAVSGRVTAPGGWAGRRHMAVSRAFRMRVFVRQAGGGDAHSRAGRLPFYNRSKGSHRWTKS